MRGTYVNVETPLSAEGLSTMLAVNLFVNSFLPFMDGSDMLCHVTLSGEHFVAMRTGNALDSAVLGFPKVDMTDVTAQVSLS